MIGILLALLSTVPAYADVVDEVESCLSNVDVGCAYEALRGVDLASTTDGEVLAAAAAVRFYDGTYPEAYDLMKRAVDAGWEDEFDDLGLYERTLYATAGWVEVKRGHFRIRYRPGVDAVLVDGALEALEAASRSIDPLLGGAPPGETVVEIHPDGASFVAASSLTLDDVRATGVVALSKWSRLLATSPRALGRGYEWQSTLAHEYIHLVVSHYTHERAPVWLQEAIAKYLQDRWKDGTDAFALGARQQAALAEALKDDALVPFSEMHPSLAKIKVYDESGEIDQVASARRAALAYTQLATLMRFCFERSGEQVLLRTFERLRDGEDPRSALAGAAGFDSFVALEAAWRQDLTATRLITDAPTGELPTVLDGGDELDQDPVLSQRQDLARYVRLGDLLQAQGRHRGALVEYERARDADDPNAPVLANRVARSLIALDDLQGAMSSLNRSLRDYPEFTLTHKTLGAVNERAGRVGEATRSFERVVELDPFDIEVREALLELYKRTGALDKATESQRLLRILERGGEDEVRPAIHEIRGEYELPRTPGAAPATREVSSFEGKPAPAVEATTLAGETVTLEGLKGKVVLFDFWATWCGPCRSIMPSLSALQQRYRDQGLVIVGLTHETQGTVRGFVDREAKRGNVFEYTLALESGAATRAYGVRSLPTLFVIDRQGIVRMVHVGAGSMDTIEALVRELLDLEPAAE